MGKISNFDKDFFILTFLLVFMAFWCNFASGICGEPVEINKAIQVGIDKIQKLGFHYNPKSWDILADSENSYWNDFIRVQPSILDLDVVKKMRLIHEDYWAIYYLKHQSEISFGGEGGFVFIRKNDYHVIGVLLNE